MNFRSQKTARIKVADETWIASALLHRENPDRPDFTVSEIVTRVEREGVYGSLRPGVRVHVLLHCVANLPPNPGRYRMLFATGKLDRRLYRRGDPYDRAREGAKILPERGELPSQYHWLLDWYRDQYDRGGGSADLRGSILDLRGLGRALWADEDPDSYVRRLREGWN